MADLLFQKSLLIQHFRAFYEEVVCLKGRALSATLLNAEKEERNIARYIFNRLVELMTRQRKQVVAQESEGAQAYYDEALYIMVALADEVFLSLPWSGRDIWREHLLEVHFFNTHQAGQKFFDRLDGFLAQNTVTHKDLGVLYLWALGLNFKGVYRGKEEEVIARYKKFLYSLVLHGSKDALVGQTDSVLCEQAYRYTLRGTLPSHIPSLRFWYKCLYGTIGVFFLMSLIIWRMDVQSLITLLQSSPVVQGVGL